MDKGEREDRRKESKEDHESIPLDLIPDILLRLPAKSVARFRCVSKLWSSITTRPDFITSFATHQSSTSARLCLLVSDKTRDHNRLFISLPQHEHPVTSYSHVDRFQINPFKFDCKLSPCSESVHGLICFIASGKIVVCNPTMRQKVTLPEPKLILSSCCLGYDPVEHKYKVLCFSSSFRRYQEPQVFTLGPQESWRVKQSSPNHLHVCTIGVIGTCIKGHVYYKAWLPINTVDETFGDYEGILMRFDVRYEKFKPIKKPDDIIDGSLLNYEGKVAWICTNYSSLRIWVLEDQEEKQEWSLRNFVLPFSTYPQIDSIWDVQLVLTGVTHDTGEFIYSATRFDETIYVLYYDPKRSHTRNVGLW